MPRRPFSDALADASDGIVQALRTQPNFKIQIVLGAVAIVAAALLHLRATSWALIVAMIGLVLGAELFNTCLEHIVDLVQPENDPLARSAKHAGAAAVLVASITALVVGAVVYGQALMRLLRHHG